MTNNIKLTLWRHLTGATCFATLISAGAAGPALAAEDEFSFEEIVVKARKRDERLQDVPISMTAFSASALNDAGIGNVNDMLDIIPSATFEPGDDRVSANVTLRGVNRSLRSDEPAFGLYYDGVYIGGQISALPQFLDLEAVEVLRGPQGALYGRNAAAGAIAIRSAQPSAESYGKASIKFANLDKQEYQGVANFALSDTFYVRGAFMHLNQDRGFNYNPVLEQELDENEVTVGRIRAKWEASEDLELLFTYEKTDRECGACGLASVITDAEAGGTAFAIAGLGLGSVTLDEPIVGLGKDDLRNNKRDFADFMKFQQDLVTLEANYDLDQGVITAIASYRDVNINGQRDNDHTVLADKYDVRTINQDSYYFELRYGSDFDGPFNFTTGVTHFKEDRFFRTEQLVRVFPGIVGGDYNSGDNAMKRFLIDTVGIPDFIFTGPNAASTPGGLSLIGALNEDGSPLGVIQPGGNWAGQSGGSFQADTLNDQTLNSWSGFIETDFDVSEKLNIWASLRYTRDDKHIDFDQLVPGCELVCHSFWRNVLGLNQVFLADGVTTDITTSQIEGHINNDFLFTNWSPGGGITYRHNDDLTFFAKVVTGFKAGGFNENSGVVENLPLEEETSTSYEIGTNAKLADGRVALRASGFFHQRRDTVIAIDDPALPPDVNLIGASNADVDTWGAELEIASHPMNGLEINAAVGYLKTKFTRFSSLKAGTLFDFSGNRVPLVYDWTVSIQAVYRHDISNDLNMFYYALYSGKMNGYLDEANEMEADNIHRINLKVGVEARDWSIIGYVDNLFDTVDIAYQNPRNQFRTFTPGRTYGIQLTKEF